MMFMIILLAIGVVLDLLSIFTSANIAGIIVNIIIAAIAVYVFLTILSLYTKIRNENASGVNNDWVAPTSTAPKSTF
jgi:hypothetical protein